MQLLQIANIRTELSRPRYSPLIDRQIHNDLVGRHCAGQSTSLHNLGSQTKMGRARVGRLRSKPAVGLIGWWWCNPDSSLATVLQWLGGSTFAIVLLLYHCDSGRIMSSSAAASTTTSMFAAAAGLLNYTSAEGQTAANTASVRSRTHHHDDDMGKNPSWEVAETSDLLRQLAIQTVPIFSRRVFVPSTTTSATTTSTATTTKNTYHRARKVMVPSHWMVLLDGMGKCALPGGESFCNDYRKGVADRHVLQAIGTVLMDRCHPDEQAMSPYQSASSMAATVATKERPLVWDLGGNVGQFSLFMRAMGCSVVAVEPQPTMNWFHRASRHVNGWDSTNSNNNNDKAVRGTHVIIPMAVSDIPGNITLTKLWQPGNKNAGTLTVDTITIQRLAELNQFQDVEIVKIDIDGPELYSLRGIADLVANKKLVVKNIIAELTVSAWSTFGFSDEVALQLFEKYYSLGYTIYLVGEGEFPSYPTHIMSQLRRVENMGELALVYQVPVKMVKDVLFMNNKVTKNFFMSADRSLDPRV